MTQTVTSHAEAINSIISSTYVPKLVNLEIESQPIPAPFQLPWYPLQHAWQLNAPKRVVRKTPELKEFQRFLVGETEIGNISRQEAVSMIPPLLLDVKPEHFVS
jgi:multisite-specific tRNA:(cytosine-C5)-methyltransferase